LVDVRTADVAEKRAHVDAGQGAVDQFANVGKRQLKIGVLRKIDDGGLIEWRERVDQRIGGAFHVVRVAEHARAGVNDERHTGRLRGCVEIGHRLLDAVVEDAKIFAAEARHSGAARGGDDASDRNHLRDHLHRVRARLRGGCFSICRAQSWLDMQLAG
jgi:hypothetical protein